MRRGWLALIFAGITAAISIFQYPKSPSIVTVIETDGPASPLDAALILRATMRYAPISITFLDPLAGEEGRPLLRSKLEDAKTPVAFSVPAGATIVPSQAVRTISFDRLMVRTERSERGEVNADLDGLFRQRRVVVRGAHAAEPLRLAGITPGGSIVFGVVAVMLAASLPWWRFSRANRVLAAVAAACAWLLLALAVWQEFGLVAPVAAVAVLPLLALIPPDSRSGSPC